jgi:dihydroorotase-like cyclic amidohydrolase
MGLLIKHAVIVNADKIFTKEQDVLLENGVIVKIAPSIDKGSHQVIDARGKKVLPGLISPDVRIKRRLKPAQELRSEEDSRRSCACPTPIRSLITRRS